MCHDILRDISSQNVPEYMVRYLDVRSTYLNGDWDEFMAYRIEKETERLYPYREHVEPIGMPERIEFPMAA